MTQRVVEKLCAKKVCVDFLAPTIGPRGHACNHSVLGQKLGALREARVLLLFQFASSRSD